MVVWSVSLALSVAPVALSTRRDAAQQLWSRDVSSEEIWRLSRRASAIGFWAFVVWFAAAIFVGGQIINHTSHPSIGPYVMIGGMFSGILIAIASQRIFLGSKSAAVRDVRKIESARRAAAPALAAEAKRAEAARLLEQRRQRDAETARLAEIPGTPEWKKDRYVSRVRQVRAQTGVTWRSEFYVKANTPKIAEARTLMRRLEATDRRTEKAHMQQAVDARIVAGALDSPRAAELAMARWLTDRGCTNVCVSPVGADGGIDITCDESVAQVKYWRTKSVGRPVFQQLHGASNGQDCIMFALWAGGYSRQAIDWAEEHDIALFTFDEHGHVIDAHTTAAHVRFGP
jgi:hypothetical protein